MFDHFHVFFTYVFQMNPFIYVIPLALRFDDNVPLLSFTLCAIIAIFKSYPSIGDVGFYLALMPLWNHLVPCKSILRKISNHWLVRFSIVYRHSFIVGCIILVTSVLSPILWYLWIYTGSANANFFFATTLAFATAQVYLFTSEPTIFMAFFIRFSCWRMCYLRKPSMIITSSTARIWR